MSFQIVEVLESGSEKVKALVKHGSDQFSAIVAGKIMDELAVGKTFQAEIGYDDILAWKVVSDFEDNQSGIRQAEDGIHLLGRIHSVLDYGDGKTVVDVYLQNGPELFRVDVETIESDDLEPHSGLEIIVGNLYLSGR
ncbi:hypothetical protein EHM76_02795 [bacterium]|nr:MAG: hypothetical protein EHM76_02795 [bacterium]